MRLPECIRPAWPAPAGVRSLVTTRGADNELPHGFNLATSVGDDPSRVAARRLYLQEHLGLTGIQWLTQVHGDRVVELEQCMPTAPEADALYTRTPGLGLAVLTADCLPVLLCSEDGSEVAAAHAGWRGLAAGIIDRTVERFQCAPASLRAWLGPAISQPCFEVGGEVKDAFLHSPAFAVAGGVEAAFIPAAREGHFYGDLYQLARLNLQALGVPRVYGGEFCTFTDKARFFSYRRQSPCGRMATVISC